MKRAFFLSVAAAVLLTAPGQSDPLAGRPDTPLSAVRDGQPMRFTYELKASAWLFILPITGKARFSTELQPDTYRITSAVKTTGLADVLVDYDLGLSATGYVRPDQLDTYAFVSQNSDGKKNRRVSLTWGAGDVAAEVTPEFGNLGDPPATPEQKIDALDPITALINFALEPRDTGADPCGGPIKVFDGRQLSHLYLDYAGMKTVRSDAWRGEAIECHVTLEKIAGFKERSEPGDDNLAGIDGPLRMWLAPLPNGATVPVRIEADTEDIGKVTLQASKLSFEPIVTEEASASRGG
ncbi:MAG: DUF3108 domain-containing protein [Pseudomonadota bacterium]